MKKIFKILAVIIVLVLIASVCFLLYDRSKIGNKIDSYKNVDVYYNGIFYTRAYGKNYSSDGYYFGQKWQCVEYIKRFYYEAKGHKMPDVYGNAKDFFDPLVKQGQLNKSRGLVQYINGEGVAPQKDDLLVFNDSNFGHVAIITDVTETDVEIIQQNIYGKSRQRFKLSTEGGKYLVGSEKKKPAGWLRKEP